MLDGRGILVFLEDVFFESLSFPRNIMVPPQFLDSFDFLDVLYCGTKVDEHAEGDMNKLLEFLQVFQQTLEDYAGLLQKESGRNPEFGPKGVWGVIFNDN